MNLMCLRYTCVIRIPSSSHLRHTHSILVTRVEYSFHRSHTYRDPYNNWYTCVDYQIKEISRIYKGTELLSLVFLILILTTACSVFINSIGNRCIKLNFNLFILTSRFKINSICLNLLNIVFFTDLFSSLSDDHLILT